MDGRSFQAAVNLHVSSWCGTGTSQDYFEKSIRTRAIPYLQLIQATQAHLPDQNNFQTSNMKFSTVLYMVGLSRYIALPISRISSLKLTPHQPCRRRSPGGRQAQLPFPRPAPKLHSPPAA
jgi:hypothetical protein